VLTRADAKKIKTLTVKFPSRGKDLQLVLLNGDHDSVITRIQEYETLQKDTPHWENNELVEFLNRSNMSVIDFNINHVISHKRVPTNKYTTDAV
jgi:hypothetical protein